MDNFEKEGLKPQDGLPSKGKENTEQSSQASKEPQGQLWARIQPPTPKVQPKMEVEQAANSEPALQGECGQKLENTPKDSGSAEQAQVESTAAEQKSTENFTDEKISTEPSVPIHGVNVPMEQGSVEQSSVEQGSIVQGSEETPVEQNPVENSSTEQNSMDQASIEPILTEPNVPIQGVNILAEQSSVEQSSDEHGSLEQSSLETAPTENASQQAVQSPQNADHSYHDIPQWQAKPPKKRWGEKKKSDMGGYGNVNSAFVPNQNQGKMSIGLKVFLWIFSVIAAGTLFGFGAFVTFSVIDNGGIPIFDNYSDWGYNDESSYDSWADYFIPEEEEPSLPETDEDILPPKEIPNVEVSPNNDGIVIETKPKTNALEADEVYAKASKSIVTVLSTVETLQGPQDSTGTGIIATSDGYIITNSHVVLNSKKTAVRIVTLDGEEYDAVVVGVDRTTDLAILKTDDHNFKPAEFGSADELVIGEWVIAIGNPGGVNFSSSLTRGVVSGLNRTVGSHSQNGMTYIQTDAAINPGNSGGPLLNMYGQVIGINSSKIVSSGYEGMGFAIPVSQAQGIINELLAGGYVKGRTRLGIKGTDVTYDQFLEFNVPRGFVISQIDEDSAFVGTEAQVGDIIFEMEGEEVSGINDLSNLMLGYSAGDEVKFKLHRPNPEKSKEGTEIEITVTLLEDKGETQG